MPDITENPDFSAFVVFIYVNYTYILRSEDTLH